MDVIIHALESISAPGYGLATVTVLKRVIKFEVINHHFNMTGELFTKNLDISFSQAEQEVRNCFNQESK